MSKDKTVCSICGKEVEFTMTIAADNQPETKPFCTKCLAIAGKRTVEEAKKLREGPCVFCGDKKTTPFYTNEGALVSPACEKCKQLIEVNNAWLITKNEHYIWWRSLKKFASGRIMAAPVYDVLKFYEGVPSETKKSS